MKNHLHFINNEHGFVLPYILFVASIVFILITANIKMYQNDQKMTEQHIEQLKIETIIQMGRTMLKNELKNNEILESVHYTVPDGEIDITITKLNQTEYHLHMTVLTDDESDYTIRNRLILNKQ